MPKDAILINTSTTTATQAQNLKRLTQMARDFANLAEDILAMMSHNNDGADWTQLETLYGLSAGNGQITFDMVNGTVGAIDGTMQNSNIRTLAERFV